MTSDSVECSTCGTVLNTDPGTPCPACGGIARTYRKYVNENMTMTDSFDLEVRWIGDMPWADKWRAVLRQLDRVRQIYAGTHPSDSADAWKDDILTFCSDVYTLKDWLKHDTAIPKKDIEDWVQSHTRTLRAAGGVTNTWKHRNLWADMPSARLAGMKRADNGLVTFEIEVEDPDCTTPSARAWSVDALGLAESCLADWRQFFSDHGLRED